MSLNPLSDPLRRSGHDAARHESPFQGETGAALAAFQRVRADLERQVARGDLTLKVARAQAATAAADLRARLLRQAEGYSPVPRVFLDRLVETSRARARARERQSLEGLQREMNGLLRQSLVEQQLQSRALEFEGRTFVRPMAGGQPAPTLDTLLAFHESSTDAGDEAAREWARRQLEGMRPRVPSPEDQRKIDLACDRPDRVNQVLVDRYVGALRNRAAEELETFVVEAVGGRDANACAAAFLLARQAPEGASLRWVRAVLDGLVEFPDAALSALRAHESASRRSDAEAARAKAEFAATLAEAEARFAGLEAPTDADVENQSRLLAKPVAGVGEPIGLTLDRRGMTAEELDALSFGEAPAA